MEFPAQFLQSASSGSWTHLLQAPINGFHFDSRLLIPGNCFIALKSESANGHDFLQSAKDAGAACALVETPDPNVDLPQLQVDDPLTAFHKIAKAHRANYTHPLVAITGSCGKTSTKDLIHLLLGKDKCYASVKSFNNLIGVPFNLTQICPCQNPFAVIEAGINLFDEMQPLSDMICADLAITTNIAEVHLEGLKSLENIAQEKSQLHQTARKSLFPESCLKYPPYKALEDRAHILARKDTELSHNPSATTFFSISNNTLTLEHPDQPPATFTLPVVSNGMAQNMALALTAAHLLGLPYDTLSERLTHWQPSYLRFQTIQNEHNTIFADCYNCNPTALRDSFSFFNSQFDPATPRLLIMGCMGELGPKAEEIHRTLPKDLPVNPHDTVIVVGNHTQHYAQGFLEQGVDQNQIFTDLSREEITQRVHNFHGNIFLKGSKSLKLWEFFETSKSLQPC